MPPIRILLLAAALFAMQGVTAAEESPPRFQVEVVIFRQPAAASAEAMPAPPRPAFGSAAEPIPLIGPGAVLRDATSVVPEVTDTLPKGFAPAALQTDLEGVARRLNTGGYRLLWHQAWVQPASVRGDGTAVPLQLVAGLGHGDADPDLQGTITLAAGRYLHLAIDASLPAEQGGAFRLEQRRRVRVGETHYYDSARLGAIALVTRIGEEDEGN
jgi:hypothetical protein